MVACIFSFITNPIKSIEFMQIALEREIHRADNRFVIERRRRFERSRNSAPEFEGCGAMTVRYWMMSKNASSGLDKGGATHLPHPQDDNLEQIRVALLGIRFGEVRVIIQDGVVIQIERMEKQRLR
jgi:hypothetical protein